MARTVAVISLLAGCISTESDWRRAQNENTPSGFAAFVAKYPESEHVAEAQMSREAASYQEAREARTAAALVEFIVAFPAGAHLGDARDDLQAIHAESAYDEARKIDSLTAWEDYVDNYPDGTSMRRAMERIEEISYEEVDATEDESAMSSFLERFPNSEHAGRVRERIDELRFQSAKKAGSAEAYREYLRLNPNATHAVDAHNALAYLAYKEAIGERSVAGYASFLKQYTESRWADKVRSKLAYLQLFRPVIRGDADTLSAFQDVGVSVDYAGKDGKTALRVAAEDRELDCVAALIELGASVDATPPESLDGSTALLAACAAGHADIASLLLQSGAQSDAVNHRGETALHLASEGSNQELVGFLLDTARLPVNANAISGRTALHYAARAGNAEIVGMLLAGGGDAAITSATGWTAWAVAESNGHENVLAVLSESGIEPSDAPKPTGDVMTLTLNSRFLTKDNLQKAAYRRPNYRGFKFIVHIASTKVRFKDPETKYPAYECIISGVDEQIDAERTMTLSFGGNMFEQIMSGRSVDTVQMRVLHTFGTEGTRISFGGSRSHPFSPVRGLRLWQGAIEIDSKGRLWIVPGTKGGFSK